MNDTSIPQKDFLEVKDIQEYMAKNGIDISIKTIYNWCDMGILQSLKLGGKVIIRRETFIRFMFKDKLE